MGKLVEELRNSASNYVLKNKVKVSFVKSELLHEAVAHIERLQAQLAEAKNLFLHERTEGLTDQEQQEEWDDAEEYFERQMALTAQQADKGE